MGIAPHNPVIEERYTRWRECRERFPAGDTGDWSKLKALMDEHPESCTAPSVLSLWTNRVM
jgi:hypothetical protein